MPELPEIETLRRDLDREVVGKRVKTVEVTGKGVVIHSASKKAFAQRLEGVKFTGLERRGTLLTFKLDSGDLLVVDLVNGGQLRRTSPKDDVEKSTQIVITFTQAGQLRFLDDTGGLKVWVSTPDTLPDEVPELAELGLDPVEEPIAWTTFAHLMMGRDQKLRALLLDPTAVVGIGPVYADEILHAAGLRYDRASNELSAQEMRRVYRALVETLHEAVKHRGATLADGRFHDLAGKPGEFQEQFTVYERDGEPCARCRGTVAKARVGNKPVYYCPSCQV